MPLGWAGISVNPLPSPLVRLGECLVRNLADHAQQGLCADVPDRVDQKMRV